MGPGRFAQFTHLCHLSPCRGASHFALSNRFLQLYTPCSASFLQGGPRRTGIFPCSGRQAERWYQFVGSGVQMCLEQASTLAWT